MDADPGRPQDAGRRHRRTGRPSAETTALLSRYQAAMRAALASLLDGLEPPPPSGQQLLDGTPAPVPGLSVKDAAPRWDLAIKLARELGAAIDPAPPLGGAAGPAPARRPARRKVDYG